MPNGILCVHCGFQCTEHHNPGTLPVLDLKDLPQTEYKERAFVCSEYTPDIKSGDLICTCEQRQESCDGYCKFKEPGLVDDY